jgi:hypothetical protein
VVQIFALELQSDSSSSSSGSRSLPHLLQVAGKGVATLGAQLAAGLSSLSAQAVFVKDGRVDLPVWQLQAQRVCDRLIAAEKYDISTTNQ